MARRHCLPATIACLGILALPAAALAHEKEHGPAVVPQAERDLAAREKMSGPTKNKGIRSVRPVGSVDLSSEFAGLHHRELRARELVIEPGGVVAVHQHDRRPGVAYILEGEIVEHRNDNAEPLTRRAGEAAFEKSGVTHWWENKSGKPVRALVVDIVPIERR